MVAGTSGLCALEHNMKLSELLSSLHVEVTMDAMAIFNVCDKRAKANIQGVWIAIP